MFKSVVLLLLHVHGKKDVFESTCDFAGILHMERPVEVGHIGHGLVGRIGPHQRRLDGGFGTSRTGARDLARARVLLMLARDLNGTATIRVAWIGVHQVRMDHVRASHLRAALRASSAMSHVRAPSIGATGVWVRGALAVSCAKGGTYGGVTRIRHGRVVGGRA